MAFDGYILGRAFAHFPCWPICTIALARWHGTSRLAGQGLASLAKFYNLSNKGTFLADMTGKHVEDLSAQERKNYLEYCKQDVKLTMELFREMCQVDWDVLAFIALSMKFYTNPKLELDSVLLEEYLAQAYADQEADWHKLQEIFQIGSKEEFMTLLRSPKKFPAMLESLGVPVPTKISKAPTKLGQATPALSRTDPDFLALAQRDDEVGLLCRMRLEHNSSIAISRAKTLLDISKRTRWLPVPLSPFQALSGRYTSSATDSKSAGTNLQGLPKRTTQGTQTIRGYEIRKAIKAPQQLINCRTDEFEDFVLVAGDSGQIEARMLAWVSGQEDLIQIFKDGGDPYSEMASAIWQLPAKDIYAGAKGDDKQMFHYRDIGKRLILGGGYGMSGRKFGQMLIHHNIKLSPDADTHERIAYTYIQTYRERWPMITRFWKRCERFISQLHTDYHKPVEEGFYKFPLGGTGIRFCGQYRLGPGDLYAPAILLPNGYPLIYPDLSYGSDGYEYKVWYGSKSYTNKLYGSLLTAHLIQGTSFALLWWQACRIAERLRLVSNTHDCWIAMVLAHKAEEASEYMYKCLTMRPRWIGDIPLTAEVKIGTNYEVA
jgi:DNA polymerase